MKLEIVVARYKEDISWVSRLRSKGFSVKVYNKSEGENLLPNVGREAHTYLHHIIENWDQLAEVTVFLQGNPFDHCDDLENYLIQMSNDVSSLMFVGLTTSKNDLIVCDKNAQPGSPVMMPIGKLYEWLTLEVSPEIFVSTPGAQFAVNRSFIKLKTKKFYQRAIRSLEYANNPIEAHCFERLWSTIFGINLMPELHSIGYHGSEKTFEEQGLTLQEYIKKYYKNGKMIALGELHESYLSL